MGRIPWSPSPMQHYEFRCFPGLAIKAGVPPHVAMTQLLHGQQSEGFEFVGTYSLHTTEAVGCLGWLIGYSYVNRVTSMVVFRRLVS